MIRALICRVLGHKERRVVLVNDLPTKPAYNRVCWRCGATRLARKRKPKALNADR